MPLRRPLAALVTPLSGPLARYGRAGASALGLWAGEAGVELEVTDAHPSAAAAMASAVAGRRRPEVVFGPYGSGPAVAAAGATRCGLWNHGGATSRLSRPRFPHVINVPAPAATYLAATLAAFDSSALAGRAALLLHSTTGFGQEVASGATRAARTIGLALSEHAFEPGEGARAANAVAQRPDAEVLLVAGAFDDEVAIAERLLRRAWCAAAFVAAGVEEILGPLGERLEGIYGPCQWLAETAPEPEQGPDQRWFSAAYERTTATPPPYPAAAAYAAGVLWQHCSREAGTTQPEAVAAVAAGLHTTTLFGGFRLHPTTGLQDAHRVGVVRWRSGRRVPVISPT
jgi:ABC-type branched-subunit amino acid transport system substrate-binding protein